MRLGILEVSGVKSYGIARADDPGDPPQSMPLTSLKQDRPPGGGLFRRVRGMRAQLPYFSFASLRSASARSIFSHENVV